VSNGYYPHKSVARLVLESTSRGCFYTQGALWLMQEYDCMIGWQMVTGCSTEIATLYNCTLTTTQHL
jgi:hypothetical protein